MKKTALLAALLAVGLSTVTRCATVPEDFSKSSTYTDAYGYTYTKDATSGNTYKYKEYFSVSTAYMKGTNVYGKLLFEGYFSILSPTLATAKDVLVYKWNPCQLCTNGGRWLLIDVIRISATEGTIFHDANGNVVGADLHPSTSPAPSPSATPTKSSN